jgi:hypothetical protein
LGQDLGLAHDPAGAAPTVQGLIRELLVSPSALTGGVGPRAGLGQFRFHLPDQPGVLGQTQHVIHLVAFTPAPNLFPTETRVPPHDDWDLRPSFANLADDPIQLLDRAGGAVDIRRPQPGAQQVIAAKDIQRQIAVVALVLHYL